MREQVVEGGSQPPQLVTGVIHRQTGIEPLGVDNAGLCGHLRNRRERTAGHQVAAEAGKSNRQWQTQPHNPEQRCQVVLGLIFGQRCACNHFLPRDLDITLQDAQMGAIGRH
ncbi:MAG: hypothetical protein ACD_10C00857G0001 [uncultured bacterium]|nr:MAG: hypothetical protein ACD_10C00857G0001 [uncultured bacterium]